MNMSVSQVINEKGKKKIYVLFDDGNRSCEGIYPDCKILKNSGFSDEEVKALEEYLADSEDTIKEMAKSISLWKAFSN